ncbi:MAG: hypothetical protein K2Y51_25980 [Gammaproteobacteria bacterium]|nr:hypothetical protein [Gammaproteobacteria bacterium]
MSVENQVPRLDPLRTVEAIANAKSVGESNSVEIGDIRRDLDKIWAELHITRMENKRSRVVETLVILLASALMSYAVAYSTTSNTIRWLVEQGVVHPHVITP